MSHTKFQSCMEIRDQKHTACTAAQGAAWLKNGSCLSQAETGSYNHRMVWAGRDL